MFTGLYTAGSYTSGALPITQLHNTNPCYSLTENGIAIKKSGITDVKTNIIVTATSAANITAQLYANGVAVSNATYTVTAVNADTYTLTINYPLLVSKALDTDFAAITVQLSTECTIVGGYISLEYRA